jgi:hypothetical protein
LLLTIFGALASSARGQTGGDCPASTVPHGSTCAAGTSPCAFTCDPGYYPSGAMTCSSSTWGSATYKGGACQKCRGILHCDATQCTGAGDPTCLPDRCQTGYTADAACGPSPCDASPGNIDHATGQCAGHTGDTCATFACELGYKPQGRLKCGADGHWAGRHRPLRTREPSHFSCVPLFVLGTVSKILFVHSIQ